MPGFLFFLGLVDGLRILGVAGLLWKLAESFFSLAE